QGPQWRPASRPDGTKGGPMPALIDTLRRQFTDTTDRLRALQAEIAEQPAGLPSDEQAANLETLNDALEALGPRIEQARSMEDRMHAGAGLRAGGHSAGPALARARDLSVQLAEFDTWGDYARALALGDVDEATVVALERISREVEQSQRARLNGYSRALVDQTTANLAGILPPSWLTDIVDFI